MSNGRSFQAAQLALKLQYGLIYMDSNILRRRLQVTFLYLQKYVTLHIAKAGKNLD